MIIDNRTVIASLSTYRREAIARRRHAQHMAIVRYWLQGMGLAFLMAFATVGIGGLAGAITRWWLR